jgi:hypothetical protein
MSHCITTLWSCRSFYRHTQATLTTTNHLQLWKLPVSFQMNLPSSMLQVSISKYATLLQWLETSQLQRQSSLTQQTRQEKKLVSRIHLLLMIVGICMDGQALLKVNDRIQIQLCRRYILAAIHHWDHILLYLVSSDQWFFLFRVGWNDFLVCKNELLRH